MSVQRTVPRLAAVAPSEVSEDQAELNRSLREGVERYLQGFVSQRDDGGLIGPFPAMLRFPDLGGAFWEFFLALAHGSSLPARVGEVAILRVAAATGAAYEIYSHEIRARAVGLPDSIVAVIVAGQRPSDLSNDEGVAHDLATVLTAGRQVPTRLYESAVGAFGERGVAELVYLVGCYQVVAALLNTFDATTPAEP